MAHKVSIASGNWSTAATWGSVTNESETINLFGTVNITGTPVFSTPFTAPSTSDDCLGGVFFISGLNDGASTVTITLQEFDGADWNDTASTATIDNAALYASVSSTNQGLWYQFRLSSPYTFTTTSTDYYRFKIEQSGSVTLALSYGSSGSNAFVYAVDDRTGAPADTDDVFILGYDVSNAVTVTVEGTRLIGSSASTTINFFPANLEDAVVISHGGVLAWDITADASLTVAGPLRGLWGGTLQMGSVANPVPESYTATLSFDNDPSATYGMRLNNGFTLIMQGATKSSTTLWKTTVASGVGTAASPLVTNDAVDWSVGDYIIFPPSSDNAANYNETEYRYIITKNSSSSYVLSNTSGGAEAALSYDHSINEIFNASRSVRITTPSSTRPYEINGSFPSLDFIDIDWAEFNKSGAFVLASSESHYLALNHSVLSNPLSSNGWNIGSVAPGVSVSDLLAYGGTSATNAMYSLSSTNLTITGAYCVDANRVGFAVGGANTQMNLLAFACNRSGNSNYAAFDTTSNIVGSTFINCEAHASRYAMRADQIFCGKWVNPLFGTKGNNTSQQINMQNNVPIQLVLENPGIGSNVSFINAQSSTSYIGQRIGVQHYNQVAGDNRFYDYFGLGVTTGTGLDDTTTRTAGSRSLRLEPRSFVSTMKFSFKVVARASKAVSVLGFAKKNATLQGNAVTVRLFLPGSTAADDSVVLVDDTAWNLWSLAAVYSGSEDRLALVEFEITSPGTSGGYLYIDDIFNGTNVITALDLWDEGFPSPIMFEQLGDPAAVWGVAASGFATGTTGEKLNLVKAGVDNVPGFIFAK